MVQDTLIAAYRWLAEGAQIGLRLVPLLVAAIIGLLGLAVLARRFDPSGFERSKENARAAWPRAAGPLLALAATILLGGALVQARKIVTARRQTVERSGASRRNEPSLSGVVQYAPAVAVLEEETYTRTLTLPPDFLTRIGAEGVQVLSPYLSDPSAEEVVRLKDGFKRSGSDVVFTREVVRQGESPVTADAAMVSLNFAGKGARRHFEATFDGTYRFRNPRSAPATLRFSFPLPQGGGTLQDFAIDAAGSRITDPNEKEQYAWTGVVPAGGEVRAHVRYRVSGAGVYDYALGSERRRTGDFQLVATSDSLPQYGRAGIYPSRLSGRDSEWSLHDVITAQHILIVFPQADVAAEVFAKTLWWLPAVLGLFAVGVTCLVPAAALRASLAFGVGLLGVPVLSAYVPPVAATYAGAGIAAVLGWTALPRSKALAPAAALLACAFVTVEHGAAFAWAMGLAATGWIVARKGSAL